MLKFGTYIETHQLRGLHQSKVGCVRTCARATCTNPPKSSCYISKNTGPIVLKFGTHVDSPAKRCAIVKSGCIRKCARATCSNTPEIPLLYLGNHSANLAQIWYAYSDPSTKGVCASQKGVHPHVRTCHVHNPPPKRKKSLCNISTTTRPIVLKFGTHVGTHRLTGLH